jgi:DEAD/DEAH box helicase domain-containing protein
VRSHKETEILETFEQKSLWETMICRGRLKVTEQISGYEKRQISTKKRIQIIQLELPPIVFETEGIWIEIPQDAQAACEEKQLHFMGGIHALEHAAIGVCPLVVMTDRNDLGGISTPFHPQVNMAAVFVYDGIPGGAGLTRQAYEQVIRLFEYTHKAIESCPCENGCPSCVHSPKCGSGNRPIDKSAALFILQQLRTVSSHAAEPMNRQKGHSDISNPKKKRIIPAHIGRPERPSAPAEKKAVKILAPAVRQSASRLSGPMQRLQLYRRSRRSTLMSVASVHNAGASDAEAGLTCDDPHANHHRYGVFDLETQRSAQEVGGWHRADQMRVSCAVLYDSLTDDYHEYLEKDISAFIEHLKQLDMVVGFNILRFDYRVLSGYSAFDFHTLNNLDLLDHIHRRLGYRLSLNHLAQITLGSQKSADGLQALKWWKEKKIRLIVEYCREDVRITRDLFLCGKKEGYLLFKNKAGNKVRVPVNWK